MADGTTGLLYRSPEEFEARLRLLLADTALRRRLAAAAYAWVGKSRLQAYHYRARHDWLLAMWRELPRLNAELRQRAPHVFE